MIAIALVIASLPPLPAFPTELRPRDGSTAPQNASFFALGDPAPSPSELGIVAVVDGADVTLSAVRVGCCVITAPFPSPPSLGSTVNVTLSSASADTSVSWTVAAPDTTAPTFLEDPTLIDSSAKNGGTELVIGVKPSDDTQIGMITAAQGTSIVGATVDGYVLVADLTTDPCVDVVITDVAGNASDARRVCAPDDGGEGEGEGEGETPPTCACADAATRAPLAPIGAAMASVVVWRRRRATCLRAL